MPLPTHQRMLVCQTCQLMYRLPGYEGDPQYDMALIDQIARHLQQAADPRPESHQSQLFIVPEEDAKRVDFESEFHKKMQESGIFIKETRDDLKVDALRCFNRHNRPKGMCPDWEDHSKAIGRTQGVPKSNQQFLCHFCPVASHIAFKERQAAGMYDVSAAEKALM